MPACIGSQSVCHGSFFLPWHPAFYDVLPVMVALVSAMASCHHAMVDCLPWMSVSLPVMAACVPAMETVMSPKAACLHSGLPACMAACLPDMMFCLLAVPA
jgi:hypothetical protein